MTHQVVRVCRGWACPLGTHCGISEFNLPPDLHGLVRWYQSPQIGEHCRDFVTLAESPWGYGADPGN